MTCDICSGEFKLHEMLVADLRITDESYRHYRCLDCYINTKLQYLRKKYRPFVQQYYAGYVMGTDKPISMWHPVEVD
jgi:hypothetical protein